MVKYSGKVSLRTGQTSGRVYVSSKESLTKVSNILEGRVANVLINKEIFKD